MLLLLLHHIVCDVESLAPLWRDLATAYSARSRGESPDWKPLPVQYADYTLWQRDLLGDEADAGSAIARQLAYWRQTLAGQPEELEIPKDRPRPAVSSYRGKSVGLRIGPELHENLLRLARDSQASLYMVLQAAVAALLTRLGVSSDIPLGSAIAGRTDDALDELVGFFVNTLVLRTETSGNPRFRNLLARVRERDLSAYAHQDLPFERLVEVLNPSRSLNRHPLFQVMLTLQNHNAASFELPGLKVTPEAVGIYSAKFDLSFSLSEQRTAEGLPQGISGNIGYASDLFEHGTVEALGRRLVRMLEAVATDPEQAIGIVDLLDAEERHQVLEEWNDTAVAYSSEQCVHELFEAQVRKAPHAVAVVYEGRELSYGELNRRANQLAHYLRGLGVKPDERVAICVERGLEMMVGLLGILKAGGAYVPLDPAYPVERLQLHAGRQCPGRPADTRPSGRVISRSLDSLPVIDLGAETERWREQPETNPERGSVGLTPHHVGLCDLHLGLHRHAQRSDE